MIKTSIEKLARDIGFDIGNSDDQVQSDLLNGFCEALANGMNDRDLNMQICYIVDKLNSKSIKVIKEIHGFIEYKESEK